MSRLPFQHFVPIWKQAPLTRYVIPLIIGIVIGWYSNLPAWLACTITVIFVLFFGICYLSKQRSRIVFGASMYLLLIAMGYWLLYLNDISKWNNSIVKHYEQGTTLIATIREPLITKPHSYKTEASIQLLSQDGTVQHVSGNIIIYLEQDSSTPVLDYGSQIIFKQPLQRIRNAGNPGGFDFERYSAFKGLYYQVFLKKDGYEILPAFHGNWLQRSVYASRDWMLHVFKKYIPGQQEAGLAEALLAGYKNDLDKDLVEQYASTGVVHIIAISGMHLALIYAGLLVLLKPFRKRKYGKLFTAITIIAGLWFFSFITGAAPSITRAALMFTVIVVGENINRKVNTYNSIAVAAFILLLINPFNLWNVGFQLSFAALLSIVTFGKLISNWFCFRYMLLNKIWQLLAVTLAAQIFTLPIVIYHFHQFPLYFLISNLLVIPISTVVLYGLMLLLATSFIAPLAAAIGWALHYVIWWMNSIVKWVSQLPGAVVDQVQLSIVQAVFLLCIVISISVWLIHKNSIGLVSALSSICIFSSLLWVQYFQALHQQKLVVYHVPQHLAIDLISGRSYQFVGDTALQQKGFLQNFHLLPARIFFQSTEGQNVDMTKQGFRSFNLHGTRVLLVDKEMEFVQADSLETDILLISKSKKLYPNKVLQHIRCKTIILDGTAGIWMEQQWKNAADSLHLRLHSTREQGAFVMNY